MKKKIALFYDEQTEAGKAALEFLRPFKRRKSDIVGKLILSWVGEHGATVPVGWLEKEEGIHPFQLASGAEPVKKAAAGSCDGDVGRGHKGEDSHDAVLLRAGLAAFLGQGEEE